MSTLYLNGDYIDRNSATIPLLDRAVLFGDALYEVIPCYHGELVGEKEHIDRLHQGEQETGISHSYNHQEWHQIFQNLLDKNDAHDRNTMIYLQVSRGTEAKRSHAWGKDIKPTIFAYLDELPHVNLDNYAQGKKAISQADIRRETCFIKSTALQVNTIMQHQAKSAGAIEAILFRNDILTEGSCSNVFIVKDGEILTPTANQFILNGVTRRRVIDCITSSGMNVQERDIRRNEVFNADEVWLTSSTKEICPIRQIDDQLIAQGHTGPVWQKTIQLYRQKINHFQLRQPS